MRFSAASPRVEEDHLNHQSTTTRHTQARRPRGAGRRAAPLLLGALLLSALAVAAPPGPGFSTAAQAIENHHGPGVNWGNGIHIHGAGAFIVNGKYVYCAEPWVRSGTELPTFVGSSSIPGNSSFGVSVAPTVGAPLQEITFVIARYGQTDSDVQAAAVALAVWEIRGADGRGNAGYEAELVSVRNSVGPEVVALSRQLRSEAASWVSARLENEGGTGIPRIAATPASAYSGVVAVPTGALSLNIENGVFSDGSTSRVWGGNGAPAGTSLSWLGRPPAAGWEKYYRVSFSGEYLEVPRTVLWGDGGSSQSSVTVETSETKPFELADVAIDTTWAPQITSLVTSKFVSVGERHSDDITVSAAPGSSEWRWRINAAGIREWMPVKARVTAYGPFLSDPALNPSIEAPAGAPVAARASFTTDPSRDHSTPQSYSFLFDDVIQEQGYYTYKWDIDGSDQDPAVAGEDDCLAPRSEPGCRVIPSDYYFTDGFGTATETQIGKMRPSFTTKLSTHRVALNDSFTDELTIPDMQNWLRDSEGNRMPLTLTGTAYLSTDQELAQSAEVSADAVPLATTRVTTDPSRNGQLLTSDPLTIPVSTSRSHLHVTMRWCVVDADQLPRARGFWEETCDDFGVPEESATIMHPSVRTEAQPNAVVGGMITDVAIIDGPVPADTHLAFEVFKAPVAGEAKLDEAGEATDEVWTAEEVRGLGSEALCTSENRTARTEEVAVRPGEHEGSRYTSPGVQAHGIGTYWWVESLIHRDPSSGAETLILSGTCGLQNETTSVVGPTPQEPGPAKLASTGDPHGGTGAPAMWGGLIAGGTLLTGVLLALLGWRGHVRGAAALPRERRD